jgi:hypothetical protein
MSRAHALAPMVGADAPFRGPVQAVRSPAPRVARRTVRPSTSAYLERAMLLWPRLDRAKIRKVADNPARIAEIVERRTSQPYDVILAMLTKQSPPLTAPTDPTSGFDSARPETSRIALRIVRSEEGNAIEVQDLVPA